MAMLTTIDANALCFMTEFTNRRGEVLIQWPMGFCSLWGYLKSKGGEVIPLVLSRYDIPMKKSNLWGSIG